MLAQLRRFGAPPEVLLAAEQQLAADALGDTISVWPENWHAVRVFLALATQWHWAATGHGSRRTGLRYEAIAAVLPAVRLAVHRKHRQAYPVLLGQLQTLEDSALAEIAALQAQQG